METHQNQYLRKTSDHEGAELREMIKIERKHPEIESIKILASNLAPIPFESTSSGETRTLIDSISGCIRSILLILRNSAPSWSEVSRKYRF